MLYKILKLTSPVSFYFITWLLGNVKLHLESVTFLLVSASQRTNLLLALRPVVRRRVRRLCPEGVAV